MYQQRIIPYKYRSRRNVFGENRETFANARVDQARNDLSESHAFGDCALDASNNVSFTGNATMSLPRTSLSFDRAISNEAFAIVSSSRVVNRGQTRETARSNNRWLSIKTRAQPDTTQEIKQTWFAGGSRCVMRRRKLMRLSARKSRKRIRL